MVCGQLGPGMGDQAVVAINNENPANDFFIQNMHNMHNMHYIICTICTICIYDNMHSMKNNMQNNMHQICKIMCKIMIVCAICNLNLKLFCMQNMHNNMQICKKSSANSVTIIRYYFSRIIVE